MFASLAAKFEHLTDQRLTEWSIFRRLRGDPRGDYRPAHKRDRENLHAVQLCAG